MRNSITILIAVVLMVLQLGSVAHELGPGAPFVPRPTVRLGNPPPIVRTGSLQGPTVDEIAKFEEARAALYLFHRSLAREEILQSGHLEFRLEFIDPPPNEGVRVGEYYVEWAKDGKFRIGPRNDRSAFLVVSDGTIYTSQTGQQWAAPLLNWLNEAPLYAQFIEEVGATDLRSLYINVRYGLLCPLLFGPEYVRHNFGGSVHPAFAGPLNYDPESPEWAWLGPEVMNADQSEIAPLIVTYYNLYAIDSEKAMAVRRFSKYPDEEWHWLEAFEIEEGVWFPGRVTGPGWGYEESRPAMKITVFSEDCWLGRVATERFFTPIGGDGAITTVEDWEAYRDSAPIEAQDLSLPMRSDLSVRLMGGKPEDQIAEREARALIRRCLARDAQLESGHIEFQIEMVSAQKGQPRISDDYYLDWDRDGKFRLGLRDGDETLVAVSNGTVCDILEEWLWASDLITGSQSDLESNNRRSDLQTALSIRAIYANVMFGVLAPMRWVNRRAMSPIPNANIRPVKYDQKDPKWAWLGESYMAAERAGTYSLLRGYGNVYAIDKIREMPVRDYKNEEKDQRYWTEPFEIEPGLWMPGAVRGMSWAQRETFPHVAITVYPESTWVGPVDPKRFVISPLPEERIIAEEDLVPFGGGIREIYVVEEKSFVEQTLDSVDDFRYSFGRTMKEFDEKMNASIPLWAILVPGGVAGLGGLWLWRRIRRRRLKKRGVRE